MKTTFRIFILAAFGFMPLTNFVNAQSTTQSNDYSSGSFLGWGNTSGDLWFKVNNTTKMTLQNSTGYLGVGTTSPTCKLFVAGGSATNDGRIVFQRSISGGWGPTLDLVAINSDFGVNYIGTGRNLGYLNFNGEYNGDANFAVGANIIGTTTEQWSTTGHGAKLVFNTTANGTTSYTARLVINNNGYVGINQTTPGSMLDVKGTLRLSGSTSGYVGFAPAAAADSVTYTLPSADGTNGQVLQTNGSGTLSWQNPTTSATAWQLTGNAGTTPSTNFIGTTDVKDLVFKTNGAENMRLLANGNINIGVNYGQHVTVGQSYGIYLEQFQVAGNALFFEPGFSLTEAPCIRGGHTYSAPSRPDYSWYYDDSTGIFHPVHGAIAFSGGGTEAMRIAKKYIGIGTTTPNVLLHVSIQDTSELGTVASKFSYGIYGNDNVFIVPKLDNNSFDSLSIIGDKGIFWSGGSSTAGFILAPYCNKYDGIRITADGNVGIGTPLIYNPRNYKLAVNGFIGAKEIYVENTSTTWPDYVFSNDYNLPSLNEVEKFVNENKHLPDVPSAAEVAEKGQAMGEMNAILLKKVEELTLYIIEQNKRMDEQQRKIQELELKVNRQQNQ